MTLSETLVYLLGLGCIARSVMAFANPQAEYALNGIRHTIAPKKDTSSGPIYMLGLWELSVGVLLLTTQASGSFAGITTLLGLMGLYKAGVAILLWNIGDKNKTRKIAGNILTAITFLFWALYRCQ
ncbi:unnamed protein product [Fusarium venenatum]|uniref:DoxX family protein n=1 Tax=Fusarium venenatum TaxID=56646 RepID=A0A2L2SW87_9HYPO|nr:uncharacterized protein FVRRES_06410 [Fusarium venenatum]KAH6993408.1 hypothetical protein EDB82DRAFT_172025 [Fusarium venenatum]CEI61974.1 unnamed protein product [Fusarium venenatum]